MNTAPQLGIRLSQRQTLAPRLSESLSILALPTLELAQSLTAALAENPLLEAEPAPEETEYSIDNTGSEEPLTRLDWASAPAPRPLTDVPLEPAEKTDLRGHLMAQIELLHLQPNEHELALILIDALDDDGYLRISFAEIVTDLKMPGLNPRRFEQVLRRVQELEPTGIAARDLSECLTLQLAELPESCPGLALARRLVTEYCEALARFSPQDLATRLCQSNEAIHGALELIRGLDPRPGRRYDITPIEYVTPELIALKGSHGWRVEINPRATPRISINEGYAGWLAAHRRETGASTLAAELEEALWLLRSLAQREQTLLRIGKALIHHQSAFLERGNIALRSLTQARLAVELELHESTISRAVNGKSMATPRGVILLRHFFSASLSDNREGISAVAVKAKLKAIIESENPSAPLSDAALVEALAADEISIARRTVAKYREALRIAGARERLRSFRQSRRS